MIISAIIVLQVLIGIGLLLNGAPKLLELNSTLKWYSQQGYGKVGGIFSVGVETIGAFLLLVGLFPRIVAGFIALNMLGAMFHHWKNKDSFRGGWEPAYLYFVASIVIVLSGVGWV